MFEGSFSWDLVVCMLINPYSDCLKWWISEFTFGMGNFAKDYLTKWKFKTLIALRLWAVWFGFIVCKCILLGVQHDKRVKLTIYVYWEELFLAQVAILIPQCNQHQKMACSVKTNQVMRICMGHWCQNIFSKKRALDDGMLMRYSIGDNGHGTDQKKVEIILVTKWAGWLIQWLSGVFFCELERFWSPCYWQQSLFCCVSSVF